MQINTLGRPVRLCLMALVIWLMGVGGLWAEGTGTSPLPAALPRAEKINLLSTQGNEYAAEAKRLEAKAEEPGSKARLRTRALARAYAECAAACYAQVDALRNRNEVAENKAKVTLENWREHVAKIAEGRELPSEITGEAATGASAGSAAGSAAAPTAQPAPTGSSSPTAAAGYTPGSAPGSASGPGAPPPASAPTPSAAASTATVLPGQVPTDPDFLALRQQAAELKRRFDSAGK